MRRAKTKVKGKGERGKGKGEGLGDGNRGGGKRNVAGRFADMPLQIAPSSKIDEVSAEDVAAATATISEDDLEDLLAEDLGHFFSDLDGKRLVPNAELKAKYPEG